MQKPACLVQVDGCLKRWLEVTCLGACASIILRAITWLASVVCIGRQRKWFSLAEARQHLFRHRPTMCDYLDLLQKQPASSSGVDQTLEPVSTSMPPVRTTSPSWRDSRCLVSPIAVLTTAVYHCAPTSYFLPASSCHFYFVCTFMWYIYIHDVHELMYLRIAISLFV